MLRTILFPVVVLAVSATLWVSHCSGPEPVIDGAPRVHAPDRPGDPFRVETTVRNQGFGHGEARVTVRLVAKDSTATYQKDESVQLEKGEAARVVVELPAPPGEYEPQVQVEY